MATLPVVLFLSIWTGAGAADAELLTLLGRQGKISGDEGLSESLDALAEARRRHAIRNIPLASTLLIRQAEQALRDRAPERAELLANTAVALSPDLPSVHAARLGIHADRPGLNLGSIAAGSFSLFTSYFARPSSTLGLLGELLLLLALALGAAIALYAAIQSIKYQPWLLVLLAAAPFAIVFVPVVLAALIVDQTKKERRVSLAALALIAAAPLFTYAVAPLYLTSTSPELAYERAAYDAFSPPADRATSEESPAARNNRAVRLAAAGEAEEAARELQTAAAENELAEPWINLAILFQRSGADPSELIENARRLDPQLTERYAPPADRLIAAHVDPQVSWAAFFDVPATERRALLERSWTRPAGLLGVWPTALMIAGMLIVGVLFARKPSRTRREPSPPQLLALVPGGNAIFGGRAAGIFSATFFALIILALLTPRGFVPDEQAIFLDSGLSTLRIVALGNVLAVMALISWWRALAR